ncbi:MAG: hypothetical protein L3J46_00120 [Kangiellaceae bacterium]|nr:hypothetical protein [Kangiellaceae bacterium]
MKFFRQTVWLLLTHSTTTLLMILVLAIALQSLATLATVQQNGTTSSFEYISIINIILASVFGIYIGGGLYDLKNIYLWNVNVRYRHTLVAAYISAVFLFTLILIPSIIINLKNEIFLVVAPFAVAIFASIFMLGKTLLHRLLIPISLVLLIMAKLDHLTTVLAMLLASVGLIYNIANRRIYPEHSNILPSMRARIDVTQDSHASTPGQRFLRFFSDFFERIATKQIEKRSQNIDWAVLSLDIKFGLSAIIWSLMLVSISYSNSRATGFVAHMLALMMIVTVPAACRGLVPQTRIFAHTFCAADHHNLKMKIMSVIDNALLTNLSLILGFGYLSDWIFAVEVAHQNFAFISIVVILVGLAFNPLLLSVRSRKQFLRWVGACSLLVAFFYSSVSYLVPAPTPANKFEILLSVELYAFIALCFVIRYLGTKLFYNQSSEMLFSD